jgi:dihydropteroate synthase
MVDKPIVMGIINVNHDSFYAGSRMPEVDGILRIAEKMLVDGAAIVDIGAQSTRPGFTKAGVEGELAGLIPAIVALNRVFPDLFISVDTFHARVAAEAIDAGASIVNDISGGNADPEMLATVGSYSIPYVCMHIQGNPETMHGQTDYHNITREVIDYFIAKTDKCRLAGIHDVIIDPGFGFSKKAPQNLELLKNLSLLKILERPLLVGLSRKSTIYKTLGTTAAEALNGTTVLNTIALLNGANILRVHDVKEASEAIKLVGAYEDSFNH